MRTLLLLCCISLTSALARGQTVKSYYENGTLKSSVPVNADGLLDGIGHTFYQTGELAMKTEYKGGKRQGPEWEYYPDGMILGECEYINDQREGWYRGYFENGNLKFKQFWREGHKDGPMWVYYTSGTLRMFALMQADTLVFAQHFDNLGHLQNEILKEFGRPIDTAYLGTPVIEFSEGRERLRTDFFNPVRVYIPGLPSSYLSFFSPHGKIVDNDDPDFPLAFVPRKGQDVFVVYLRIKTHPEAQPIKLQTLVLPVE